MQFVGWWASTWRDRQLLKHAAHLTNLSCCSSN